MAEENVPVPIEIRGHMLLCLQGFRGEGYSPAFVQNMSAVSRRLQADPSLPVRVTHAPDQICKACPNLNGGCALRGPGFERRIVAQDLDVLRRLGLFPDQVLPWSEVLARIGGNLRAEMLPEICGTCQWLSLGYCQEGIDRLRTAGVRRAISGGSD